jgi:N,N-dimethylformamidase beta subunit-like protein/HYDIN/CFA65/VesB family protein/centrosomal CEP192-like protein
MRPHGQGAPAGISRWWRLLPVLAGVLLMATMSAPSAADPNPIVVENQQPGTTSWQFTNSNKAQAHEIEGYASLTSVNKGGQISFMVSLSTTAQYTMDIYRMGWYPTGTNPDGTSCAPSCGGRLMQHVGPLSGARQATCPTVTSSTDANYGLIECNWTPSYTLTVPTTWTQGVYLVKLTRLDGTHLENYMTFVVRDDSSTAPVLYSLDTNTWQAYNYWGGLGNNDIGINLYGRFNDLTGNVVSGSRAYTVSFDRPYLTQGSVDGAGDFFMWDFGMVRWMESQGYDMTYVTDTELQANPNLLLAHRVLVNTGHDEYYSDTMRTTLQNGIAGGVNLAMFSANDIYSRVTWSSDGTGAPLRRIHTSKGALNDNTMEYRYLNPPQPENAILGVMSNGVATARPWLVYNANSWVFAGTGLVNYVGNGTNNVITSGAGQNALAGLVGYEFDERAVNAQQLSTYASFEPPGVQEVAHSFVPAGDGDGFDTWSDATLYTAPSGATVFAAGTIQWSFAVDNGYNDGFCNCFHNVASDVGRRVAANILNRLSAPLQAPAASLSPASLSFGPQQVGTTSSGQTVTLTNTGTGPLTISSIGITGTNAGDFGQTNTCPVSPSTLAAGANCTVSVRFSPSATGTRSASLSVTDDAPGSPQTVTLSGSGTAPAVTLTPATLSFGNQTVGTTSAAQTATLQNTGSAPLTINSIGITGTNAGDFAQTNTCPLSPSTLAPGSSCSISVTFSPTLAGSRSASVSVNDNAPASPQTVALNGTGVAPAPAVTFSPTSLGFGQQQVGTTSSAQSVTLTNTGTGALTISSIGITGTNAGDFSQTNACPIAPSTLAAGSSCSISVTFTPSATGSRSAGVSVADNAPGSPQTVPLSGSGSQPAVTLIPPSLSFGSQLVGTTSTPQTSMLQNTGNAPLHISGIAISGANAGDFAQTNDCPLAPSTLLPGAGCSISVTFSPTLAGTRSASVSITDDAPGSPQTVVLSGSGVNAAPAVSLSPISLGFGSRDVGTTSSAQPVTLTNTGTGALTIGSIGITGTNAGDFAQTNTCPISPSTLAAGANCTISVTFTPSAGGSRSASVSITDDAPGSPQTVPLTGSGNAPAATLTPSTLGFGNQLIGTTSGAQTTTLQNTGSAALHISSIAIAGANAGDFAQTSDCPLAPSTLAAGSSCTISVSFSPSAAGSRSASVSVNDDAPDSPQTVGLSGTGVSPAPAVSLAPASLGFGSQAVGTTSSAQSITLTNTGTGALTIASIGITGTNAGDFGQTNTCPISPSTLAAGGNCTISVTFSPSAGGSRSASLSVNDDAPSSPQTAPLSGSGTTPAVTLTPATLSFGNQLVGTTSAAQTTTLQNTGSAPLHISSIGITGTNATDFAQTNSCPLAPSTLAPGASCSISVTFSPTLAGSRSASVSVADDAPGNPQTVGLGGTGVNPAPAVSLSPTSLGFGLQAVGTTSAAQSVILTNTGTGALTINSIAVTGANAGDFAQTSTCPLSPATLAAGANCSISVTFTPTATGSRSASLSVTDNAPSSPQTVALSGTGGGPIAFDANLGAKNENATSTTMTLTTTGSAAAQTRVFVFVNWFHASRMLTSVSGGGLTWTVDAQIKDSSKYHGAIASASAPVGLPVGTVITATFSGSVTHGLIAATSFSGIVPTGAIDATATSTQHGVAAWTGTVTTINPHDLVLGWSGLDHVTTSTPTAPNVEIHDFSNGVYGESATSAYRIEASAGAKTVNGTWLNRTGSTANNTTVVAYKGF